MCVLSRHICCVIERAYCFIESPFFRRDIFIDSTYDVKCVRFHYRFHRIPFAGCVLTTKLALFSTKRLITDSYMKQRCLLKRRWCDLHAASTENIAKYYYVVYEYRSLASSVTYVSSAMCDTFDSVCTIDEMQKNSNCVHEEDKMEERKIQSDENYISSAEEKWWKLKNKVWVIIYTVV